MFAHMRMQKASLPAWIMRACLAGAILLASLACKAQGFPSRPIRLIVSAPPGTAPDIVARTVGQKMSENLGRPTIVDNRPGGGGIPAINSVISAAPDGYTLLITDTGVYSILPNINTGVDPLKSLVPISLAATTPLYLGASATLNVSTLQEFIAVAKAKPGLPYGSAGNGTAHHLFMELVKSLAGIDLNHIPHKGVAPAVQSMLTGDIAAAFAGINLLLPQAKAGKLRILGVASDQRSGLMRDIPTIAEAGLPGFNIKPISKGYFAPLGTPADITDLLRAEITRATRTDDVVKRLLAVDIEIPSGFTAELFVETVRTERQVFGKLVKAAGILVQ